MPNQENGGALRGLRSPEARRSAGAVRTTTAEGQRAHPGAQPRLRGSGGRLNDFYEDLGFATTPDVAEAYRAEEREFQGQAGEQQGKIDSVTKDYETAKSAYDKQVAAYEKAQDDMPDLKSAVNDAWSKYKKGLTGVRVMGPGDKVEATYWLPSSALGSIGKQRGIFASKHGRYMNVMVKNYRNQELHDSLRSSAGELKSSYKAKAAKELGPALEEARAQMNAASGALIGQGSELQAAKGQIDTASSQLQNTRENREAQWQELRDRYAQRVETLREVLGGK